MIRKIISKTKDSLSSLKKPQLATENTELIQMPKARSGWAKLFGTRKRKIVTILAAVVVLAGILLAIPLTRYSLLGWAVKKDVSIHVLDAMTQKPVSDTLVTLGKASAKTDKDGNAKLPRVSVGEYTLMLTKKYYRQQQVDYTVPIFSDAKPVSITMNATGRQVVVKVVDKISNLALKSATISASGTSAITDQNGEATIVLPVSPKTQKGHISKDGYNFSDVTLTLDSDEAHNSFAVTPSGSIVYLSNATGTLDVMKSNLDGTNSHVIIAGTGSENKYQSSLLASRDWKYAILHATRQANQDALFIVDIAKESMDNIDEGNAAFNPVGWSGHNFIYTVDRVVPNTWTDKAHALKSYNADTGKLTTLDETSASGSNYYDVLYQYYSPIYILENEVVFAKSWSYGQQYYWYGAQDPGNQATLYSINPSTNKKTTVKSFPQFNNSLNLSLYEPQGVYLQFTQPSNTSYYEYEDGGVKPVSAPNGDFYDYPTYLVSPSGNKTFWYELRDGKNAIFIGDKDGKNAKQIATLSDYVPYGWYGDNDQYILFTKKGSELYIAPAGQAINGAPLKVTDYYKAQVYPGYGYGYGGQ